MVCEGGSTTFTCILNSSISKDDVQWHRFIKDTGIIERLNTQGDDMIVVPIPNENSLTTKLYISNARESHAGYYWVRLPSDDVCNVSLTTVTSM